MSVVGEWTALRGEDAPHGSVSMNIAIKCGVLVTILGGSKLVNQAFTEKQMALSTESTTLFTYFMQIFLVACFVLVNVYCNFQLFQVYIRLVERENERRENHLPSAEVADVLSTRPDGWVGCCSCIFVVADFFRAFYRRVKRHFIEEGLLVYIGAVACETGYYYILPFQFVPGIMSVLNILTVLFLYRIYEARQTDRQKDLQEQGTGSATVVVDQASIESSLDKDLPELEGGYQTLHFAFHFLLIAMGSWCFNFTATTSYLLQDSNTYCLADALGNSLLYSLLPLFVLLGVGICASSVIELVFAINPQLKAPLRKSKDGSPSVKTRSDSDSTSSDTSSSLAACCGDPSEWCPNLKSNSRRDSKVLPQDAWVSRGTMGSVLLYSLLFMVSFFDSMMRLFFFNLPDFSESYFIGLNPTDVLTLMFTRDWVLGAAMTVICLVISLIFRVCFSVYSAHPSCANRALS